MIKRFSFHATYFYYPDEIGSGKVAPPPGVTVSGTKLEWANLSLEYRW